MIASHDSCTELSELRSGWTQRTSAQMAAKVARFYFSMRVVGQDRLPSKEPFLLCANHCSHMDTFVISAAFGARANRLVFLGAQDYFARFRIRGWILRRITCLASFQRGNGMSAAKHNLKILAACRDAGRIVVLFPEGTRSPDGSMHEFKPGVSMFADKLGMRVVPCHIEGSHAVLPKGKKLPRRSQLRLTFGSPLTIAAGAEGESAAMRSARYQQFAAELQVAVAELGHEAREHVGALLA